MTKFTNGFLAFFFCLLVGSLTLADQTYYGIGCVVTHKHNSTVVTSVLTGGPAANAGIQAGEYITAVDGVSTLKMALDKVVDLIRGVEGSSVVVTVGDLNNHVRDLTIKRGPIVVPDCFVEGNVLLNVVTMGAPGSVSSIYGHVGDQQVSWMVTGNVIRAYFKGEFIPLTLIHSGFQNIIEGNIHGQFIRWMGGNVIASSQGCIQ